MPDEKEKWDHLVTKYPSDFSFRGEVLPTFPLALEEFRRKSKGEWSLSNYKIAISVNDDQSYAAVSFLPDPAYFVNGIPFEIADRGMYRNGMAIVYIYRLGDLSLVNTSYMR
ncbi:hypothetical protein [Massilia sp. METH4]|uniref:hypothetical protein n=1 Tax=Massilia sp. METH4 TaxID=3123041 RepID=UPI0030CE05A6